MHSKKQRPLVRVMGRAASVITHARDFRISSNPAHVV